MKNQFNISILAFLLGLFILSSCHRDSLDVDVLPQEELSDIVLTTTDLDTKETTQYQYQVNSSTLPTIQLENGHSYDVSVVFLNGNENVTQEIIDAKNEHFLIYNFPNSNIELTRIDGAESTRDDGARVGLKTRWDVTEAVTGDAPKLILTLYHEPKTVSEAKNGTEWGKQTGGETDAVATFNLAAAIK